MPLILSRTPVAPCGWPSFPTKAFPITTRQLLSQTVTGLDVDGDRWTLRLQGPGTLSVAKQGGASLDSASLIDSITIAGTDSLHSRLVGTVVQGSAGDGKVFFKSLQSIGGKRQGPLDPNTPSPPVANGIFAIDMPNFWLGDTGGDPIRLARRHRRVLRRRLVLLCDISGSMEPYARAYLQFLTCAAGSGSSFCGMRFF